MIYFHLSLFFIVNLVSVSAYPELNIIGNALLGICMTFHVILKNSGRFKKVFNKHRFQLFLITVIITYNTIYIINYKADFNKVFNFLSYSEKTVRFLPATLDRSSSFYYLVELIISLTFYIYIILINESTRNKKLKEKLITPHYIPFKISLIFSIFGLIVAATGILDRLSETTLVSTLGNSNKNFVYTSTFSFFAYRGNASLFLLVCIALNLNCIETITSLRNNTSRDLTVFLGFCLILSIIGLLFTQARLGVFLLIIFLMSNFKNRKLYFYFAIALVVLFYINYQGVLGILDRFTAPYAQLKAIQSNNEIIYKLTGFKFIEDKKSEHNVLSIMIDETKPKQSSKISLTVKDGLLSMIYEKGEIQSEIVLIKYDRKTQLAYNILCRVKKESAQIDIYDDRENLLIIKELKFQKRSDLIDTEFSFHKSFTRKFNYTISQFEVFEGNKADGNYKLYEQLTFKSGFNLRNYVTRTSKRFQIYSLFLNQAKDFFLFGTGPGTFHLVYLMYRSPGDVWEYWCHCDPLEIFITQGIIGLVMMSTFYVFHIVDFRCQAPLYVKFDKFSFVLLLILLYSFFDFPLQILFFKIIAAILMASNVCARAK